MASSEPAIMVCTSHGRPRISTWVSTVSMITMPRLSITRAGTMNRYVGLWTSRKRRGRQPWRGVGAGDDQEAGGPPPVAPRGELPLPSARVVLDRELPDVQLLLGRPHDHL